MARNKKKSSHAREIQDREEKTQESIASKASSKTLPSKPKTAIDRRKDRVDGIKKTVYPSILGVAAGFVCFYGPEMINQMPWHFVILVLIGVTYFIQKVTYPFLGINAAEFKSKDWFYVEFMAIDLWLVTWTLLLN